MGLAKRIVLFLLLNFLVVITISFLLSVFGLQPYLTSYGLNIKSLAIFCLIWGMGGAFISLALSRIMVKWAMRIQMIDPNTRDPNGKEILNIVYDLAKKAGLSVMPEVGVYDSPEVNAFATGPTRKKSLVAISSGLLRRMDRPQIEGVLGHEISHVANGDMVTMTLLQGVVNAFVMFLARIIAFAFMRRSDEQGESSVSSPFVTQLVVIALEVVFMILGSIVIAAFARYREYRADAGGAKLAGKEKMISALQELKKTIGIQDKSAQQPSIQAFKISNPIGIMRLFASHPSLDDRIERLQNSRA